MPSSNAPPCPHFTQSGAPCKRNCMPGHTGCRDHNNTDSRKANQVLLKKADKWAQTATSSDDDNKIKKQHSSSAPAKKSSTSFLSFPDESPVSRQRAADDFSDIPKLIKQDAWTVKVRASSAADLDRVIEWLVHEIPKKLRAADNNESKQKAIAAGLQALGAREVDF